MEVIIVTGISGAGKSQAIKVLEDQGYYCVDNMPLELMKKFLEITLSKENSPQKVAFVVDVRGAKFNIDVGYGIRVLNSLGIKAKIFFLEASNEVILRRYSETRRVHPVTSNSPTAKDIDSERRLLKDIRDMADIVIDTSKMKGNRLAREIASLLEKNDNEDVFIINISSFGFKHGLPSGSDIVMDMRFIPNPYYVKSLKNLTGNSKKVRDYVMKHIQTKEFIDSFVKMINTMIPNYIREGKHHLNISFGCTGGQHRSVAIANQVADIFISQGKHIVIEHRDVKKR